MDDGESWIGDLREVISGEQNGGPQETDVAEEAACSSDGPLDVANIVEASNSNLQACRQNARDTIAGGSGVPKRVLNPTILCAVNSCHVQLNTKKADNTAYKFYRIPSRMVKYDQWVATMKNADTNFVEPWTHTSNLNINFQVWVCERHFEESHFENGQMREEKDPPSLNLGPDDGDPNVPPIVIDRRCVAWQISNKLDCAVGSCPRNSQIDRKEELFFKLPSTGVTRILWVRALRCADPTWKRANHSVYVCHRHFDDDANFVPKLLLQNHVDKGEKKDQTGHKRKAEVLTSNGWCCADMTGINNYAHRMSRKVSKVHDSIQQYALYMQNEYAELMDAMPHGWDQDDSSNRSDAKKKDTENALQEQIEGLKQELKSIKERLPAPCEEAESSCDRNRDSSEGWPAIADDITPSPSKLKRIRPGPLSFKMKTISRLAAEQDV